MNKIDVSNILHDHLGTLRDFRTEKALRRDYILFFGIPLCFAAAAWFLGGVKVDVLNALLAAFSIFGGFLLNLLAVVYTVGQSVLSRMAPGDALISLRRRFLREILANISFGILASIGAVIVCFMSILLLGSSILGNGAVYTHPLVTVLLVYLTINFTLTLLLIVGRVYELLIHEFDRAPTLKKVA